MRNATLSTQRLELEECFPGPAGRMGTVEVKQDRIMYNCYQFNIVQPFFKILQSGIPIAIPQTQILFGSTFSDQHQGPNGAWRVDISATPGVECKVLPCLLCDDL